MSSDKRSGGPARTASAPPTILVIPVEDPEHQFNPGGEYPEIRVDVRDSHFVVTIVGDPTPRQVNVVALDGDVAFEGDEGAPIHAVARPFGSDAVAVFPTRAPLPAYPTVYVDWEQPVQLGMAGITPPVEGDPARIWSVAGETSEEDDDLLLSRKQCDAGEVD